ncbi:Lrp/AsnC family transcriptional regulator [Burkholderia alba]|uniref:Lrp/AsnC family transcriptional regulator n=1 Tax=Burkholderia alba TaxID=2683677 RepID=UPI002B05C980|nr:Lrp/AsnC family transcriptional regulator [Burkholderia alba]
MPTELDTYDRKLLAELQQDARLPQGELGARVNLSAAAVNRRLKRLHDEGTIEKYTAVVAPDALGYPLTIVVEVEVANERIDLLDAMKQTFAACPQVQQCYYVAGEWDFVLIFAVRHMEQYTELTRELFFNNNNVKRFKTLVAMSRVKTGLAVPIDVDPPPAGA